MWFPVYASAGSFGFTTLLSNCNTRYGWLVGPYPAGTLTLQEAPSFAWRTNVAAQRPAPGPHRQGPQSASCRSCKCSCGFIRHLLLLWLSRSRGRFSTATSLQARPCTESYLCFEDEAERSTTRVSIDFNKTCVFHCSQDQVRESPKLFCLPLEFVSGAPIVQSCEEPRGDDTDQRGG